MSSCCEMALKGWCSNRILSLLLRVLRASVVKKVFLMILEGLVTTLDSAGAMHLAPMGPTVDGAQFDRFQLRPFPTSQTYQNLCRHGEGVLHVSDDVLLLAGAAVGRVDPETPYRPASRIRGFVLADCCRYYEFRVAAIDARDERVRIDAEVVHAGRVRDFFGFNRAKHAVVEAAILATRTAFLPPDTIAVEMQRLGTIVGKTGGPEEHEALALLERFVSESLRPRTKPPT